MNYARKVESSDFETYHAVSTVLSHFGAHDTVSTRATLQAIRWMAPLCHDTDEELIKLIVTLATGRTMGVAFDHKAA